MFIHLNPSGSSLRSARRYSLNVLPSIRDGGVYIRIGQIPAVKSVSSPAVNVPRAPAWSAHASSSVACLH